MGGALVPNPFPKFVSHLRKNAKRLAWGEGDDLIVENILGTFEGGGRKKKEAGGEGEEEVDPYVGETFDGYMEGVMRRLREGDEGGWRGALDSSARHT